MSNIPEMGPSPRAKFIAILLMVLVLIGLVFLIYQSRGLISDKLKALDLIPTPERFTELYFNNASALPTQIAKDQPIAFSFVIHNEEGAATIYPYEVYFETADGNKTMFTENTASLADNASTTIDVSYLFKQTDETGTVVVDLTSLDQQIDFLLPRIN
jgi:hypothetical protein